MHAIEAPPLMMCVWACWVDREKVQVVIIAVLLISYSAYTCFQKETEGKGVELILDPVGASFWKQNAEALASGEGEVYLRCAGNVMRRSEYSHVIIRDLSYAAGADACGPKALLDIVLHGVIV